MTSYMNNPFEVKGTMIFLYAFFGTWMWTDEYDNREHHKYGKRSWITFYLVMSALIVTGIVFLPVPASL